ncbi:Uncharacterised protein [Salmonella enterica subsp. arizonae]|nr:Uncharacterised protein [Salmonella enterica subsp. arizonae]
MVERAGVCPVLLPASPVPTLPTLILNPAQIHHAVRGTGNISQRHRLPVAYGQPHTVKNSHRTKLDGHARIRRIRLTSLCDGHIANGYGENALPADIGDRVYKTPSHSTEALVVAALLTDDQLKAKAMSNKISDLFMGFSWTREGKSIYPKTTSVF